MINVGDTVYLVYIGYVTVVDVKDDGVITIIQNGRKSDVRRTHYRKLDEMERYIAYYGDAGIPDYTERRDDNNGEVTREAIRCYSDISVTKPRKYDV